MNRLVTFGTLPLNGERPPVSIIVRSRGDANFLEATLRSFAAHNSYRAIELTIIDQASCDATREVLERWRQFLPIAEIVRDEGPAVRRSVNGAAGRARGELLLMIDSDILFVVDVLPHMVAMMAEPRVGALGVKQLTRIVNGTTSYRRLHIGMRFDWDAGARFLRPASVGTRAADIWLAQNPTRFPVVAGAVLMCRRSDFLAVGGLCEDYAQSLDDVDFCIKIRHALGKEVLSFNAVHVLRQESKGRDDKAAPRLEPAHIDDRETFKRRCSHAFRRLWRSPLLHDDKSSTRRPFTAAFAVTTTDANAGAGDLYTARGLGRALHAAFGWKIVYLPKRAWYDVSGVDLFISMRDDVDISQLRNCAPHLLTIAWIRNWLERWVRHPWIDKFDLLLCSSRFGADFLKRKRLRGIVFPIAADPALFRPGPAASSEASDYVFTGNNWRVPREVEEFDPRALPFRFAVYGKSWEGHPRFGSYSRGFVAYERMVQIYNSAKLVVDDAVTHVTKPWGSLNSRVFEALAAGALVLTNNEIGARELFVDELPVWRTPRMLREQVSFFLSHPQERERRAAVLRAIVLRDHTYERRANALVEYLDSRLRPVSLLPPCGEPGSVTPPSGTGAVRLPARSVAV